jgi:tRNA dimethylallyltransferase
MPPDLKSNIIHHKSNLLVVTGSTATGKTAFAAHLAYQLNGEIISADSRQVYKGMDKATGKDLSDYVVNGTRIPYHLVDIVDPGYEYNVFEFQKDFISAFNSITTKSKLPILCGGTGLYIESVLKGYRLIDVPENLKLRANLENKKDEELITFLKSFKTPHNVTDTSDRKRLVRAIEIQQYYTDHPEIDFSFPEIHPLIFGIHFDRATLRKRITDRLDARLGGGMVEEVRDLLKKGLKPEQLKFYGLEYKFLTQFVIGEICYNDMYNLLNTAIHQFAKRQMTWFRKMERGGVEINWIDGRLTLEEKVRLALDILNVI